MGRIQLEITREAEDLLRAQNRHRGDMGKIVSELIVEKFAPKPEVVTEISEPLTDPAKTCVKDMEKILEGKPEVS